MTVPGETAYHLFKLNVNTSNSDSVVKLYRKATWHPQFNYFGNLTAFTIYQWNISRFLCVKIFSSAGPNACYASNSFIIS